jgi:hypothetical protein
VTEYVICCHVLRSTNSIYMNESNIIYVVGIDRLVQMQPTNSKAIDFLHSQKPFFSGGGRLTILGHYHYHDTVLYKIYTYR